MTRSRGSVLNSSVNFLLVAPTVTSFQPALESDCRVSTFLGEPQSPPFRSKDFLVKYLRDVDKEEEGLTLSRLLV